MKRRDFVTFYRDITPYTPGRIGQTIEYGAALCSKSSFRFSTPVAVDLQPTLIAIWWDWAKRVLQGLWIALNRVVSTLRDGDSGLIDPGTVCLRGDSQSHISIVKCAPIESSCLGCQITLCTLYPGRCDPLQLIS